MRGILRLRHARHDRREPVAIRARACCSLFGLLGYGLRRFGYPIAPVVVGLILGPMAEQQLRRALAITQGDPSILAGSAISITILLLALFMFLLPIVLRARGRGKVLAQLASDTD